MVWANPDIIMTKEYDFLYMNACRIWAQVVSPNNAVRMYAAAMDGQKFHNVLGVVKAVTNFSWRYMPLEKRKSYLDRFEPFWQPRTGIISEREG